MFSFLKKDKQEDKPAGDLPPMPSAPIGDLPPISAPDLPPLPEGPPEPSHDLPPVPESTPEMPPDPFTPPETPQEPVEAPPEMPAPEPDVIAETETMPEPVPETHDEVSLFPQKEIVPQSQKMDFAPLPQAGQEESASPTFPTQFVQQDDQDYTPPPEAPPALRKEVPEESDFDRPLFVRADLYSDVLLGIDDAKGNLRDAEETLFRAKELKSEMDREYQKWHDQLEDIQRKLVLIDQSLFE